MTVAVPSWISPVGLGVDLVILTVRDDALMALAVRRANSPYRGRWALPGGFVEANEDIATAAVGLPRGGRRHHGPGRRPTAAAVRPGRGAAGAPAAAPGRAMSAGYPSAGAATGRVEPVPRRIRAVLGGSLVLDTRNARYGW